ncbi:hypothetical protein ACFVX7_16730, partial [Streptomyces sp. NPDC058280]
TANQLTYFCRNGEAPHRTSGLRVACTAVRTSPGWRFSESQITLAWMQEKRRGESGPDLSPDGQSHLRLETRPLSTG